MKKYIFYILILFIIFSNASIARGSAGKVFAGIFSGVVVDALGKAYDNITGKTDIKILKYELDIIKNKIPEMKDSIELLINQANKNTSIEEYMRIVSIEKINLMGRIDKNTMNIENIQKRLLIIEKKTNNSHNPPVRPISKGSQMGEYIDHGNGTITDTVTGLMWKKCSEGQIGANCSGKIKRYEWSTAMQYAKKVIFGGYDDWRIPSKQELGTLLYCSNGIPQQEAFKYGCAGKDNRGGKFQYPTANLLVFPRKSFFGMFWTSSLDSLEKMSMGSQGGALGTDFFSPGADMFMSLYRYSKKQIRLVRNGQ